MFDPRNSYKNYRETIRKTKTPCVPYLYFLPFPPPPKNNPSSNCRQIVTIRGVFLSDLTFLDENADTVSSADGTKTLINFSKRRRVYEVISQILYFRDFPYTSLRVDVSVGCSLLAFLSDNTMPMSYELLQQISLKLEPREESNTHAPKTATTIPAQSTSTSSPTATTTPTATTSATPTTTTPLSNTEQHA